MKTMIKIAKNLWLPLETVTQSLAILARKRSGKSFLMRRIIEQLFKASQQVVIADPKGDWWGIRSSADGKSPGLPVVILGGEHADVPLEPTIQSGELVAQMIVEERVSALLDLGHMRKGEMRLFMTAFMETIYRLKAQERFRTTMMLALDEADMFAPQKPGPDEARMLGAVDDIVRRGGQRGMGCMFATQRSAVLNKNILSQAQILIGLRTIAPQDLKAFDDWIDSHGTPEQREILMKSLPSLPVGNAWVWSPGWPTEEGIFERVQVLPIETFDSGATPKPGQKQVTPKTIADIDLSALRTQMAETIERAKADDPKELKKKIAELQKKVAMPPAVVVDETAMAKAVEKANKVANARADKLRALLGEVMKFLVKINVDESLVANGNIDEAALDKAIKIAVKEIQQRVDERVSSQARAMIAYRKECQKLLKQVEELLGADVRVPVDVEVTRQVSVSVQPQRKAADAPRILANGNGSMTKGMRTLMIAVAQYPAQGITRSHLSILTGYKQTSRNEYIKQLKAAGYVNTIDETVIPTPEGIAALGSDYEQLPTGSELLRYWMQRLPQGEGRVLEVIVGNHPNATPRESIDAATGYKQTSRNEYIKKLIARQLVQSTAAGVLPSPILFD